MLTGLPALMIQGRPIQVIEGANAVISGFQNVVLAFSGRIGSGKTSISREVAKSTGYKYASFGDHVRQVALYLDLDASRREVLQDLGWFLARYPEQLCRRVLQQADYQQGEPLVIDGVRTVEVLEVLRSQVAPSRLLLVYVAADEDTLIDRARHEGRYPTNLHLLEQHPIEEQTLTTLPEKADIVVRNDDSYPIKEAVREIIGRIVASERG
jgi:shikimate kinase